MPGTITASWRRTQEATRTASRPLLQHLERDHAGTPLTRSAYWLYQNSGTASIPYSRLTATHGPVHRASTTAFGMPWVRR